MGNLDVVLFYVGLVFVVDYYFGWVEVNLLLIVLFDVMLCLWIGNVSCVLMYYDGLNNIVVVVVGSWWFVLFLLE